MFERRLKIVMAIPIFFGVIFAWRLYDIQVRQGDSYLEKADAALLAPRQFLPPLRGRIVDRFGEVLVSDEPAHDVTVHYGILSMNEPYLLRMASLLARRSGRRIPITGQAAQDALRDRIAHMWVTIQQASGLSLGELRERRDAIGRSVEGLRRHIWDGRRRRGFDESLDKLRLREEDQFHTILRDVSPEVRTRIELELSDLPFVRIEPSVRRVWSENAGPLCHVLGRLGEVSQQAMDADPYADDSFGRYRAGDSAGVSGVERLGEQILRGRRGFEDRYLDGSIKNRRSPIDGMDVQLTIDLELQRQIESILGDVIAQQSPATGGSCVVIDVATREILALVSYPTFSGSKLSLSEYAALRDDTTHLPLRFRAVGEEYQPGSILKPAALLAGMANDLIDPMQHVFCDGSFIPGSSKWHCWTHWRGMAGHGEIGAEEALQHSCNIFFYSLGQKLGARRLTALYDRFLRGPLPPDGSSRTGTGLIEERAGTIPDVDWIRSQRNRSFSQADGRNYAIGQGELQITPLQAANLFASIASGGYREPTLVVNDGRDRPLYVVGGVQEDDWALVRRGLYRCVNEDGGTAFKYVHMPELEICGKTGSAQCVPRVVTRRYSFQAAPGEAPPTIIAPTVEAAREGLGLPANAKVIDSEPIERWPPLIPEKGEVPTHAWFAGFAPYRSPRIALAIIIEYGGGGGSTAGPAARAIFQAMLDSPRGFFDTPGEHLVTSPGAGNSNEQARAAQAEEVTP